MRICLNCPRPANGGLYRCWACHTYLKRNGRERPPELINRQTDKRCDNPNCDKIVPGRQRVCEACRMYRARHGHHRPLSLIVKPIHHCVNCGDVVKRRRHGRCPTCAHYIYLTGRDRPQTLIQRTREKNHEKETVDQ